MMHSEPASQTLADWLAVATGDLVPSAQARVRAEIETHYAEALRARMDSGISEPEAHAASLGDLGNADDAARRFRRLYPTVKDAEKVADCIKLFRSKVMLAAVCLLPAVIILLVLFQPGELGLPAGIFGVLARIFLVASSGIVIAAYILARRKATPRPSILFGLIFSLNFCVVLGLTTNPLSDRLWLVFYGYIVYLSFSLLNKWRSVREDDLPPDGPVGA